MNEDIALMRLRKICLDWPGAAEVRKWGHPVFVVREKIFAGFGGDGGGLTLSFKARPEERAGLLEDPRFAVAPYVGRFGWLTVRLDTSVDWKHVESVLRGSYDQIAAKTGGKKRPARRANRR